MMHPPRRRLRRRLRFGSRGNGYRRGPDRHGHWRCLYRHRRLTRVSGAFVPLAENHFSSSRLQHRRNRDVDRLANHFPSVVHHDHGAVIQIGDALVVFLAFLQNEDAHSLAREHNGLQGIRQFVDIQDFDSLELCDFVQVEVVGDDLALVDLGEFNQFQVDFADGRKIIFHNLNLQVGDFLQALQNVEAAPPAIALQGVGGIGDELQFAQHELRGDDDAVEEAGLGNVGDAPVDDDAGVENLVAFLALLLAAEDPSERGQVQQITLVGPDDEAHIGHQQHDQDLQEALGVSFGNAVADDQSKQVSATDAEETPDGGADESLQTHGAQLPLEEHDGCPEQCAHARVYIAG